MATTIGHEYDHISISDGTDQVVHYLKDATARNNAVKLYNTVPTNYISGDSLVVFDDAGEDLLIKQLSLDISPEQDFNGYDKPWAGGAGKNILSGLEQGGINGNTGTDGEGATTNRLRSIDPISVTVGQSYTISMTTSASKTLQFGVSFYPAIGEQRIVNSGWQTSPYAVQAPADATVMVILVRFSDDSDIVPSDVYNVQMELGTTATAYEPYENICPITGHTGVTVTRTGKNLYSYPYAHTTKTVDGITWTDNGDGSITATGTAASGNAYFNLTTWADDIDPLLGTPGTKLTISGGTANIKLYARYRRAGSTTQITMGLDTGNGATFTVPDDVDTYISYLRIDAGVTVNNITIYPILQLSSETDTTYEPYRGQSVSINLTSIAGDTVYGGSLTLNGDGTGTVVVTHGITIWDGTESLFKFGDTNCYSRNVNDGSVAERTSAGWLSANELSQIELISNLVEVSTNHEDTTAHASAYCSDSAVLQPCLFLPDCSTVSDAQTWTIGRISICGQGRRAFIYQSHGMHSV